MQPKFEKNNASPPLESRRAKNAVTGLEVLAEQVSLNFVAFCF